MNIELVAVNCHHFDIIHYSFNNLLINNLITLSFSCDPINL